MRANCELSEIRHRLSEAHKVLIFAHLRPDADSIGASMALAHGLLALGKEVELVSVDPIPAYLHFLFEDWDGKNPYISEPTGTHDCLVVTDISSADRAGQYLVSHPEKTVDICIDHHISNDGFAVLNWVEDKNPATCSILAGIFEEIGLSFTPVIAKELLAGMITDTNGFSVPAVTSHVMRTAAKLMDLGAPLYDLTYALATSHSVEEVNCWKAFMSHMTIRDGLAWSYVTKCERMDGNFETCDDAGFVTYLLNTKGVKVSVIFIQLSPDSVKVSWRGRLGIDVSKVAVFFGGGGHRAAAGATVHGTMKEVQDMVFEQTRLLMAS